MLKQYFPAIKYGNRLAIDEANHAVATVTTNGTAAVNVFTGTGLVSQAMIIADVVITSLDTTAGNITVENPAGTVVATIAKGTVAGVVVGAIAFANTTVAAGNLLVVKSSSAGNATVRIYFNNSTIAAS